MQRIPCPERDDWQVTAEATGFDFHTLDGERYWDERAYYAFTLDEIERQIEGPSRDIHAMCLELVKRAMADENILRRLKIPAACWPIIRESWQRGDATLYGRFDFSFDGKGPAKLLEYNAAPPPARPSGPPAFVNFWGAEGGPTKLTTTVCPTSGDVSDTDEV